MSVFIETLLILCVVAFFIYQRAGASSVVITDNNFKKLQNAYLPVYYLATFSDWLQGPYVYKLYRDYGFDDDAIAVLYIAGFVSSCLFGMVVGQVADKYGRKFLCSSFGVLYSVCCLSKLSPRFAVLFVGRVFGGVSTSILFSTFEAWYVNEHLNHYKFPPEWLNVTFGEAAFNTGLLAIVAGIMSQFTAETLQMGSICPFLLAVPFLIASTFLITTSWEEHPPHEPKEDGNFVILSALNLIFCKETLLLLLCFIQSFYESVMYVFIFSWTPILSAMDPPLGLVFSVFMVAFMVGTKLYTLLISKRLSSQSVLTLSCAIGFISHLIITVIISSPFYTSNQDGGVVSSNIPVYICFFCFVLYEVSVGLYFPAISYMRGRVIPEKYRATVTNVFRVPMNIFTCFGLVLKRSDHTSVVNSTDTHTYVLEDSKFPVIFIGCSVILLLTTFISFLFGRTYLSKMSKRASLDSDN